MLDIGSLVSISKIFLETFAGLKDLLTEFASKGGGASPKAQNLLLELRDNTNKFQARLEGLATQLEQSERLNRMIPTWEAYANQVPVWKQLSDMTADEAQRIHVAIRDLVHSSIRDQFSSTFFRTEFDKLPGMEDKLKEFRTNLNNLDRTLSTIPAGNFEAFKALWPNIMVEFNNLRNSGHEVGRLAEDIHGRLIDELLRSTREARIFLSQI